MTEAQPAARTEELRPAGTRRRSAGYPGVGLERCEMLGRKLLELGGRGVAEDALAQGLGHSNAQSGSFLSLRAAAKHFGLVELSGGYISLTREAAEVLHEGDEAQVRWFRIQAIRRPTLFRKLLDRYCEKQLPSLDRLARELALDKDGQYGVLKRGAERAARAFLESVRYARLVDEKSFLRLTGVSEPEAKGNSSVQEVESKPLPERAAPAALDTYEVTLTSGERVALRLPARLHVADKERLKAMIDLIPDTGCRLHESETE